MPSPPPDAPPGARLRSRTFAALADHPDYRRFYAGQGVSLIGTWLQAAAVSWIVYDLSRSEWTLGVVEAAGILPGLAVGLVAGALADLVRPQRLILGMQVGQMALALLLAVLVGTGAVRIWQMALILALTRVCVTFEMPSRQVFLHELVGREGLMNAIALNSGLFNASRVIGPALAGVCLVRFGATACFVLNGATYLAAIAALLKIRPSAGGSRGVGAGRGPSEVLAGLSYVREDRRVRGLFMLMAYFGVVGMGYQALLPAYARRVVGTQAVGYSVLLSFGGIGATVGALMVASLGGLRRKEGLVLGGMATFGLAMAAAGTLPGLVARGAALPVAAGCMLAAGFGGILFYAATQTLIQAAVPDHLRGRVMGVWMIIYSGSVPLGSLWAGLMAQRFGVSPVLGLSAVLCMTVAAVVLASGVLATPAAAVCALSD